MAWGVDAEQEPLTHGSETRNLTLLYATGNFIFELLEATKSYWAQGETIHFNYRVKNNGTVSAAAKIDIYDGATLLGTWSIASLPPGYSFEAKDVTSSKVVMPARDWVLTFVLTP